MDSLILLFVFHDLRIKSKISLGTIASIVYLYEYSNYLIEGLGSRFIVQLVISVVTWIVKCMLFTLDIMIEPCKSHCA